MMVDSDDIVSDRIAEICKDYPCENGFVSRYGFVYNEGDDYVKKMSRLYRTCGSCAICKYTIDDLPEKMPDNWTNQKYEKEYIIRSSHRKVPMLMKQSGRPLKWLNEPTTIYVRNTGDNHSMVEGDLSWKRKIEIKLRRKIKLSSSQLKSFRLEKLEE